MSKKKNPEQRAKIMQMFDNHCAYCGCDLDDENSTVDHIIPKIKGGTNAYENLYPSCGRCNSLKSDRSIDEYRVYILERINQLFPVGGGLKFYFERIINLTE
jgi:uncharacterized protein (TIGR02646 family)